MTTEPIYAYRRGPKKTRAKRQTPEMDLQASVLKYLAWALPPGLYRIRGATEGAKRTGTALYRAKSQGLSKGWPDLMLFNRQTRAIRWIELKDGKKPLTAEQEERAAELRDHMAVCRSVEDVERALLSWGVTPRVSIAQANRYGVGT